MKFFQIPGSNQFVDPSAVTGIAQDDNDPRHCHIFTSGNCYRCQAAAEDVAANIADARDANLSEQARLHREGMGLGEFQKRVGDAIVSKIGAIGDSPIEDARRFIEESERRLEKAADTAEQNQQQQPQD